MSSPLKVAPSLLKSATLIAAVTILSKLFGLFRDQALTHAYGASLVSDAYNYAFQIPSFFIVLLGGLGGPFHTATISVLSKTLDPSQSPTETAQRITNSFLTATAIVCGLLSIAIYLFSYPLIDLMAHNAPEQLKQLAAMHLQWMSPLILIGGVIGIFYGVSNIYHRFFWPSFSPSAINIILVLWLMFIGADSMGWALAVSTLLGGILQLALQLPDFFKTGFRLFPAFNWKDPQIQHMGELLFPATIGTSIGQMNIYVAMFFVSQLDPGGWTATQLGNRLIQLPIGVLTIAMLVPLFPRLTRWVQEQNFDALKSQFKEGILSLWLLALPMIALIFLIGERGIQVLFERGAFDHHATLMVTSVLMVLSLSILPYMLRDGITRIFYAFNDSKTPLVVGLISIGVNAFFNWLLVDPFQVAGVAFAQVIVTVCNAALLVFMVRKHIPNLGLPQLILPTLTMALATILATGIGFGTLKLWDAFFPASGTMMLLLQCIAMIALVGVIYLGLLLLFRVELAHKLLNRLIKKPLASTPEA